MEINAITNGIVLDHIKAGKSMEIYNYLHLNELDCQIAIIQNTESKKMGKKDILKIATDNINIDLKAIGYIDPGITINKIKDSKKIAKITLELPEEIEDVIKCKNPRCITSTEQGLKHRFKLVDKENKIYRCIYCDTKQ